MLLTARSEGACKQEEADAEQKQLSPLLYDLTSLFKAERLSLDLCALDLQQNRRDSSTPGLLQMLRVQLIWRTTFNPRALVATCMR